MRLAVLAVPAALAACAPHAAPPAPHEATVPVVAAGEPGPGLPPGPSVEAAATTPPPDAGPTAEPSCVDDGAPYELDALRERVARLAAVELDGRGPGSDGDAVARGYIAARFRCLGLVPAGADGAYEQPFMADGHATANLLGYIPGTDPAVAGDIVLVGAHHDHLGDGHLGANDDASGVSALVAIAQAVRQHGEPARTIAFAVFGGEELGLVGSEYFAAHAPAALPLDRIVYDVNLDMVGSYRSSGAVYAMGTFRGLPGTAIMKALAAERPRLHVGLGGRGVGSDHEAFCRAGVPYVFFWTPDKRCYHERCDTVDRLDAAHLADIAGLAGGLVERLAASPADLAASRVRLGCRGR